MQDAWRFFVIVLAFLIFAPFLGWAQTAERTHEITVDDYLSVHLITDCETSPDGRNVAFAELRWGDHDKPRTTDLWVVNTKTRRPVRLTFDPVSDYAPQWGPDGQHLYFMTKRDRGDERPPYDGSTQVWVIGTHPGEPLPITRVKDGINGYQLSKDGRTIYYTKEGEEAEREWEKLRGKYSEIKYGHGPVNYTEIWKLNLESWREEKVAAPERVITEFNVSDDESRIAMITTPDGRLITKEGQSRLDVFDVQTEQVTTLPDKLYREDAPTPFGWLDNLAWSSDGSALAVAVGYDGYPTEILVAEWTGGEPSVRLLTRPDEVHVTGQLRWIPKTADLCFLAEDHARRRLHCVTNVKGGTQGAAHVLTPGDVVVHSYSYAADGKQIALVKSDTENCRDVYWYDGSNTSSKLTRLTRINLQMDTWILPRISHVTWISADGTEVGGILELPNAYTPDQGPLPMVVELHGGPTDCTKLHLRYWIYGRTILAAKGYALLSPNYRGSTGYGDKFMTDLIGHENDLDVQDILAGVDAMIERGVADPERLGVMGWSNGGFLTNCLIVTTPRFKAASSGAGTVDQLMQWSLEDTPGHVINYMRGLPWERTEAYLKASPAWQLDRVTTPTIIHVGEKDARVPAAHSRTLYRGLKDYGTVPTLLLVYPGAGHGLRISDNRKGKLEWDVAWFDRYLLGKTDEPGDE
ncbi:MAG: S9 family peptidase [Phycisphaerae bacterium]|nr:S9 family peptidase [Phycisphaerae bacterium]